MNSYNLKVFSTISSTQKQLIADFKQQLIAHPMIYLSLAQSDGIGSNGRVWVDATKSVKQASGDTTAQVANTACNLATQTLRGCAASTLLTEASAMVTEVSATLAASKLPEALQVKALSQTAAYLAPEASGELIYQGSLLDCPSLPASNLFVSFTHIAPKSLPQMSASIYYAMLVSRALRDCDNDVFVKWPNDLYINDLKVGGLITYRSKGVNIVGLGINQNAAPKGAARLNKPINLDELIKRILEQFQLCLDWPEVFKEYSLSFHKSSNLSVKYEGKEFALKDARLFDDGSILIDNKRLYGLR